MLPFSSKNNTALTSFLSKSSPDRYEWLFIVALTTGLTFFLYENALNGYWRFDDGFHLRFAVEHSPWQYFFIPSVTQSMSGANVAPWNAFFYDVNLSLFGFESKGFYLHLLLLIILTSLALYSLLRTRLLLPSALLGVVLFLLGKPTLHMAHELMSNHYLTGMLFSLLSINFFIRYLSAGKAINLSLSLLLYILAISCKEVYVPLVAVLLFMPVKDYKQRIKALIPFALVVLGYAFWRQAVLGSLVGGYDKHTNVAETSYQFVVEQLVNIPFVLFDNKGWGLAALLVIFVVSLASLKNRRVNILLTLASIFIILVPLIALVLSSNINQAGRYLFLPWVALSIWIAVAFQNNKNTSRLHLIAKFLGITVLIISCPVGQWKEVQSFSKLIIQAENIYHFVIESDFSTKALMVDTSGDGEYWAFVGTSARSAHDMLQGLSPDSIAIITSDIDSVNGLIAMGNRAKSVEADLSAVQFYRYQDRNFRLFDIKPVIHSYLKAVKAGKDQAIEIKLGYKKGLLSWDIQPKNMSYLATLWFGKTGLEFKSLQNQDIGEYPLNINTKMNVSISIKSPTGWVAVSPMIQIPEQGQKGWQGKTDVPLIVSELKYFLHRLEK